MSNFKKHLLFYITSALFIMVMISMFLLSGIYAKYLISSDSEETARVAKFDVGTDGGVFTSSYAVEVDPVTPDNVADALTLENSTEVAVACELKLTSLGDLPLIFTWTDGTNTYTAKTGEAATVIFPPLSSATDFDLMVSWDTSDEANSSFIYRGQVDKLTLDVVCKQLD